MKNLTPILLSVTLYGLNAVAFAQATPGAGNNSPNPNVVAVHSGAIGSGSLPSCFKIRAACETAGFVVSGPKGKNLLNDCAAPVMLNKTVPNLKLDPGLVDACKNEMANQPCVKIMQTCHDSGFDGTPGKLPMFDCLFPLYRGAQIPHVNPSPTELASCKTYVTTLLETQPCLRVMLACRDAGYSPDSTVNGQIFARNCYIPVISGKQVPGVVVDSETIAACAAKMKVPAAP